MEAKTDNIQNTLGTIKAAALVLSALVIFSARAAVAQTLSGRVVPPLGASIQVWQGNFPTTVPVNQNTGEWSYTIPNGNSYEVKAINPQGHFSDPPRRAGAAVDTNGLDFTLRSNFQWKQIFGRVRQGNTGIGRVQINTDKIGSQETSIGGNGQMPAGMYNFVYQPNGLMGLVRLTPSKSGIMSFMPSSRLVNGDVGLADVNFGVPSVNPPAPTPTPAPTAAPAPSNPPVAPPAPPTHHTISGRVVDLSGQNMAGATIFVHSTNGVILETQTTDASGTYDFTFPRGTTVYVRAERQDWRFSPMLLAHTSLTVNLEQTFTGEVISVPPVIDAQPSDVDVAQHYWADFQVSTISSPYAKSYQWFKNGQEIPGETNPRLYFPTQASDNGSSYQVRVTNQYGTVWSDSATLTVHTAPTIVSHPQDVTVESGDAVTFSVTAVGEGSFRYLWLTNGTNFPGLDSRAITLNPELDQDGNISFPGGNVYATENGDTAQIWVLVTNQYGNVLSNAATIQVVPKPAAPQPTTPPAGNQGGQPSAGPSNPPVANPAGNSGTPSAGNPPASQNPAPQPTPGAPAFNPGTQGVDALISAAKLEAGTRKLPRGRAALKAKQKEIKLVNARLVSAERTLANDLSTLNAARPQIGEAEYQRHRGELVSYVSEIKTVRKMLKRKGKKIKRKLRRK